MHRSQGCCNPGLELANAFSVIHSRLFKIAVPRILLANSERVRKGATQPFANAFSVIILGECIGQGCCNPGLELANAFSVIQCRVFKESTVYKFSLPSLSGSRS